MHIHIILEKNQALLVTLHNGNPGELVNKKQNKDIVLLGTMHYISDVISFWCLSYIFVGCNVFCFVGIYFKKQASWRGMEQIEFCYCHKSNNGGSAAGNLPALMSYKWKWKSANVLICVKSCVSPFYVSSCLPLISDHIPFLVSPVPHCQPTSLFSPVFPG